MSSEESTAKEVQRSFSKHLSSQLTTSRGCHASKISEKEAAVEVRI